MIRKLTFATALSCMALPVFAEKAFIAFKDELPGGIAAELTRSGVEFGVELKTINALAVDAPREVLEVWAHDPRVRAITLQRRLELHMFESREQLNAVGIEQAETFSDAQGMTHERPGVSGAGVSVAVIDTGIFSPHPDFGLPGASRVTYGRNFELSLFNRELGVLPADIWDAYAQSTGHFALVDEVGHGTHAAGSIGASGFSSSGLKGQQQGIAPDVQLVSMRIASPGNGVVEDVGFEANAVAAIDYMIRYRKELGDIRVSSNSWGLLDEEAQGLFGPTDFDPIAEVVSKAIEAGIIMVFSAGNSGGDASSQPANRIPSGMDEVISVAAGCKANHGSCPQGQITGFSSRGTAVDVTAPGDRILSTASPSVLYPLGQISGYFGETQDIPQNRVAYTHMSGTSMSAPQVAGVVALMVQANPDLRQAEALQILSATADDMVVDGDPELVSGRDIASGWGMVNARRAVEAAELFKTTGTLPGLPSDATESATSRSGNQVPHGGALGYLLGYLVFALVLLRRRTKRI